jgi:hypothetical protein
LSLYQKTMLNNIKNKSLSRHKQVSGVAIAAAFISLLFVLQGVSDYVLAQQETSPPPVVPGHCTNPGPGGGSGSIGDPHTGTSCGGDPHDEADVGETGNPHNLPPPRGPPVTPPGQP